MGDYRCAASVAVRECEDDPEGSHVLSECLRGMRAGEYGDAQVDVIAQRPEGPAGYDMMDAWCYAQVHAARLMGQILACQIQVGSPPGLDSDSDENGMKVSNLPRPFRAELGNHENDSDGVLRWDVPIKVEGHEPHCEPGCPGHEGESTFFCSSRSFYEVIPAGAAPLEVGWTDGCRSWVHLGETGFLARWPVGSPWIHLLVVADPGLWIPPLCEDRVRRVV